MPSVIDNERFRKLLRSHPEIAIELIYDLFSKSLLHYAITVTKNKDVAKGIVQEAFVQIWDSRKKLSDDFDKSIEHYLVRIVRNKAADYFRDVKHINIDELSYLQNRPDGTSFERTIMDSEFIHQVRGVISTFPPRERECLLMRIDSGMTPDQIAAHLKITRKAVEKNLTSANKRLRKWGLGKEF